MNEQKTYGEQVLATLPESYKGSPYLSDVESIRAGVVNWIDKMHALGTEPACTEVHNRLCQDVINSILIADEKVRLVYEYFNDVESPLLKEGQSYRCLVSSAWHDADFIYTIDKILGDKIMFSDGSQIKTLGFVALVQHGKYKLC